MGYHLAPISKGAYGTSSKIREELEELEDSLAQNNRIMAACELADIVGAVKGLAENLGFTWDDIMKMQEVTERAFKDGTRIPR